MTESRGRLGAYAAWQLRDYFTSIGGIGSILLPFMLGVFPMLMIHFIGNVDVNSQGFKDTVTRSFDVLVSATAWLGATASVATLISADRMPGLNRFLFAKPVGVSNYYLQAWCVRGVSLAVIMLVLAQIVNIVVAPVPWSGAVTAVAESWILIGGFGLLLSVFTMRDGLLLVVAYVMVTGMDTAVKARPDWHWMSWLLTVMPPMHKLSELRHAALAATPIPMGSFWHVMGYGAACTALAAYLVRRLPLVR